MTNKMCNLCGRNKYSIKISDDIYGNVCSECHLWLYIQELNYVLKENNKGQIIYETCIPIDKRNELAALLKRLPHSSMASFQKAVKDAQRRYIMRPISFSCFEDGSLLITYSGQYRSSLVLIEFHVRIQTSYSVRVFKDGESKTVHVREFA